MIDEETFRAFREEMGEDLPALLDVFLSESPRLWAEALAGGAAGDWRRLRRSLHTLRTSIGLVGMQRAAMEMADIERLSDGASMRDVNARLAALDAQLREGWSFLERYRM